MLLGHSRRRDQLLGEDIRFLDEELLSNRGQRSESNSYFRGSGVCTRVSLQEENDTLIDDLSRLKQVTRADSAALCRHSPSVIWRLHSQGPLHHSPPGMFLFQRLDKFLMLGTTGLETCLKRQRMADNAW
jgi:hypothetical protein